MIALAAATPFGAASQEMVLERPSGYALVFADEFERDGEPAPHWHFETQRNRDGWYNRELQYYSAARRGNAMVRDGRLLIEARREDLSLDPPGDWGGQAYSSARLTTLRAQTWRYGYFEVRARLPCQRGAWPAIWLLPRAHDRRWKGGEIDIAEVVGQDPGLVHHAVHTEDRNFRRGNHQTAASAVNACGGFHDYQLLWTPDRIVVAVDGRIGLTAPSEGIDKRMGLILNVAIGGDWAGRDGIDDDALPARMEIEHVRVWQAKEGR